MKFKKLKYKLYPKSLQNIVIFCSSIKTTRIDFSITKVEHYKHKYQD